MTDDHVKEFKAKFASRLTAPQQDLSVKFWRVQVEGVGGDRAPLGPAH